jgi:hypothetical protein
MFRNVDALIVAPCKVPLRKDPSLTVIVDSFLSMLEQDDASATGATMRTLLRRSRKRRVYIGEPIVAADYWKNHR